MLTVDQLRNALPKNLKGNATQAFADKINTIAADPEIAREVRENFLTYSKVLTEGNFKTEDYLSAVMYCTFKLMGMTNKESYIRAFPDRYTALVAKGTSEKDISAYVGAYSSNKLVNTILEQAYIPIWLLNRDVYQKAINTQMEIMYDPLISPMARTAAANSLLLHLKQPEVKKIELDVKMKNDSGLDELRDTMAQLAETQAKMIADGAGAQTISRVPLKVVAEREEITDVLPQQLSAPASVMTNPMPEPDPVPVSQPAPVKDQRPSLFAAPPKGPEDIKKPVTNYARCCDNSIEDCMCVEPEHVYIPTTQDTKPLKRVSLFDDPAGMP